MLCDALKRTADPRAPDALIDLIDDDDIAGHAIYALRSYGPKTALPAPPASPAEARGAAREADGEPVCEAASPTSARAADRCR
jgi:hypothetical protein